MSAGTETTVKDVRIERFTGLLQDDRRFWMVFAYLLGLIAVLKGLRRPNHWTATQAQIDYSFGLVKRGFFGQFVTRPLHLYHYEYFALASFAILCALAVLLLVYVHRSGVLQRIGHGEVVALFFASYSVTYIAHVIGYFDILLGALVLLPLLVRNDTVRMLVSLPVCVVAILIHESFLVLFLPVLLLSFVLSGLSTKDSKAWWKGAVVMVVSLATTFRIAFHASLTGGQVVALQEHLQQGADFELRSDVFEVMGRGLGSNMHLAIHRALSGRGLREQLSLLAYGPTLVLLLLAVRQVLRAANTKKLRSRGVLLLAALVSLSPLCMPVLAWDTARFDALVNLTAFLVLLTVCAFTKGPHLAHSTAWVRAALVVIVISMASGEFLLNGKQINTFPFIDMAKHTIGIFQHHVPPPVI